MKKSHRITFNREYADHLLVSSLSAQSYSETLVEEITCLDRSAVIRIDIKSRTFETALINYMENSVDLDSKEGMQLLDSWFFKWTNLIRNLKRRTDNITTHLSGGHETRMVLGLFLGSGINMNDIHVLSLNDGLHCHSEDFKIATELADFYGFKLNDSSRLSKGGVNLSLLDTINNSFNLKLGFHTQMYWQCRKNEDYKYLFTGEGIVRYLAADLATWKYEDTFIDSQAHNGAVYGQNVAASVRGVLTRSFSGIKKKYESLGREISPEDICYFFYRETRMRNHYGKALAESYLSNTIKFCPILDSTLHKLKQNSYGCEDRNLLVTVIFDRYNRDLLNFEIEGGRDTAKETIAYARYLDEKYPFTPQPSQEAVSVGCRTKPEVPAKCDNPGISPQEVNGLIKDAFYSPEVKGTFEMLYSPRVYYRLAERWKKEKFHPESNAYVVLAITKAYLACISNRDMRALPCVADYTVFQACREDFKAIDSMEALPAFAENITTARIDIQNKGGTGNDIEILDMSDKDAVEFTPVWFSKNGQGHIVTSNCGKLDMRLRCIGGGTLRIYLRAKDVRDAENKRVPLRVYYKNFTVNGKTLFDCPYPVCHDEPYLFTQKVSGGDVITLHVLWVADVKAAMMGNAHIERNEENLAHLNGALKSQNAKLENMRKQISELQHKLKEYINPAEVSQARVDVKNAGAGCDVEVIKISDADAAVHSFAWMRKNGNGRVITSTTGVLDLKLKCKGNGKLSISLLGRSVKDADKHRLPVWVCYTKFAVDGKAVFNTVKPAWHDAPQGFCMDVKDGQAVDVHAEWAPECLTIGRGMEQVKQQLDGMRSKLWYRVLRRLKLIG